MGYIYVLQRGLQPLIFTVKASTIQAVLSFAIASHWPLYWLEVKKAFLNGLSLTPSSSWDLLAYFDANGLDAVTCEDQFLIMQFILVIILCSGVLQLMVSWSSCESKYQAMTLTAAKIKWLGHLLQDLKVSSSLPSIKLCDSQSFIFIVVNSVPNKYSKHNVVNSVSNKHSKHIDLDRHFVRELVASKKLQIHYLPTNISITDMFTKSLGRSAFIFLHSKLRILDRL